MLILVLDASGGEVCVVLCRGDDIVRCHVETGRPLAIMHKAIENLLADSGLTLADVDQVAVVQGPGLWTGLHIAMDTAKTIALVSGKPLIPLNRLDAMAESLRDDDGRVVVLLQASRDQFFIAQYDIAGGHWARAAEASKGDLPTVVGALRDASPSTRLAGDISELSVAALEEATGRTYLVSPMYGPTPEALARLASASTVKALTGDGILDLEPLYMQGEGDMPKMYLREPQ